ncbi:macrophage mannose receptor 1-like [Cuculus canorus]|uniref:macrophage mannose receptor 1-like n=1 Tax=Cuculus canorus TaxID=55661 RepID=UPI0023AA77B1|nr:macrophage mannose receptor 1-like [Cuculus canorus]
MYGNVEVLGPGEACSDSCPTEENLYEPLDPPTTIPSQKSPPEPRGTAWSSPTGPKQTVGKAGATRGSIPALPPSPKPWSSSQKKLVLVGTVALGVSVLVNVVLLTVGSRHVAVLREELEAEKEKERLNEASRSFLLYNEHHRKCVEAQGLQLTATTCRPNSMAQRFQWLPGGRLRNQQSHRCAAAAHGQNLSLVRLEPCRADNALQRWECRGGGLLALAGYDLYFNYGNNVKQTVMLYTGDREWSRWVIHGSKADVCSHSCCPPCSKGWIYFRNSCYFHSTMTSSWADAQRFCSALGAQLLEVDDPEEKELMQSTLRGSSWLGIRDEDLEGTWKRADGTVLSRQSSWWHRNEPNGERQENCAAVRADGEWYDFPCTSELAWVCEGPP